MERSRLKIWNFLERSRGWKILVMRYVSSLIGRAAVSKTAGWGFESLLTCLYADVSVFAVQLSGSKCLSTPACTTEEKE